MQQTPQHHRPFVIVGKISAMVERQPWLPHLTILLFLNLEFTMLDVKINWIKSEKL